jgi:hypothetical protein
MKALARDRSQAMGRDLEEVRELFQRWRYSRKVGTRIPAGLWQAAVSLFPRYTVNQISRFLKLDYMDVRKRVDSQGAVGKDGRAKDYCFWELRLSELQGHIGECRLRAEDGAGRKVELELKCVEADQLLQLLGGLWGKR